MQTPAKSSTAKKVPEPTKVSGKQTPTQQQGGEKEVPSKAGKKSSKPEEKFMPAPVPERFAKNIKQPTTDNSNDNKKTNETKESNSKGKENKNQSSKSATVVNVKKESSVDKPSLKALTNVAAKLSQQPNTSTKNNSKVVKHPTTDYSLTKVQKQGNATTYKYIQSAPPTSDVEAVAEAVKQRNRDASPDARESEAAIAKLLSGVPLLPKEMAKIRLSGTNGHTEVIKRTYERPKLKPKKLSGPSYWKAVDKQRSLEAAGSVEYIVHGERTYLNRAALEEVESNDEDNSIRPIQPQMLSNQQLQKRRLEPRNSTKPAPTPTDMMKAVKAQVDRKKGNNMAAPQPQQKVANGAAQNGSQQAAAAAKQPDARTRSATPSKQEVRKAPSPEKPAEPLAAERYECT